MVLNASDSSIPSSDDTVADFECRYPALEETAICINYAVSDTRCESYTSPTLAVPQEQRDPSSSATTTIPSPQRQQNYKEVYQGIYSNGTHFKYTTALPDVTRCLQRARDSLSIPTHEHRLILALSAIVMWNRPSQREHWVFWNEKAYESSSKSWRWASEQGYLLDRDIWNEVTLANVLKFHNHYWTSIIESEAWYRVLVPSASHHHNLRKRGRDGEDGSKENDNVSSSLPAKRPRVTRSSTRMKGTTLPTPNDHPITLPHRKSETQIQIASVPAIANSNRITVRQKTGQQSVDPPRDVTAPSFKRPAPTPLQVVLIERSSSEGSNDSTVIGSLGKTTARSESELSTVTVVSSCTEGKNSNKIRLQTAGKQTSAKCNTLKTNGIKSKLLDTETTDPPLRRSARSSKR